MVVVRFLHRSFQVLDTDDSAGGAQNIKMKAKEPKEDKPEKKSGFRSLRLV
jgi:hypothetical protein